MSLGVSATIAPSPARPRGAAALETPNRPATRAAGKRAREGSSWIVRGSRRGQAGLRSRRIISGDPGAGAGVHGGERAGDNAERGQGGGEGIEAVADHGLSPVLPGEIAAAEPS